MNNRETAGRLTRRWQSGQRERQAPALVRDRPVAPPHRPGSRPAATLSLPRRWHRVYAWLRHHDPPQTTKAPDIPGPLMLIRNRRLLQRGRDRGEVGGELAADALNSGNDRNGDTGADQTLFDSHSPRLLLPTPLNVILHK